VVHARALPATVFRVAEQSVQIGSCHGPGAAGVVEEKTSPPKYFPQEKSRHRLMKAAASPRSARRRSTRECK